MKISDNPYKIMYHFLKNVCQIKTNCGAGCPWGKKEQDDSFYGSHYKCRLDSFNEFELIVSMNLNMDFLKSYLDLEE